ncbi:MULTISPECIES: SRPBCC family protein [Corallincola]|uniref:Ubiquinone-binding protein n=3 Tax=Corallincola TaxID=1775176 RepID=A0A368NGL2_9GAMM|nr:MULTISPECIES: SRPBCC family protein [Corallincola]RCU48764.1 ubiquinone-binding protein [Corallincola holothuriorum]TAA42661.1 ubiquinone-binding protein [Corallincola spongiicola]TCI01688.1 ubiquinone-binding protein [Corallincola luteus]
MPQIQRSALVGYSAAQMYSLVNDVESYANFLPGCGDAKVHEASELQMLASVQIAKAGVNKWFTTRNQLAHAERIEMQLVDGPFRQLVGNWYFMPLDEEACKISFSLEFEFSGKLVELAFGKLFNQMASNMVDAFVARAKDVYGS